MREADQSPPATAEGKKTWISTFTTFYVFMAQYLVNTRKSLKLPLRKYIELKLDKYLREG
jgi:hypothetical protein